MNHFNYNNSVPRTFEERPFATYNNQNLTQQVPFSPKISKITFNKPQNLPQPLGQSKTYFLPQTYVQANYPQKSTIQNQTKTDINKITTAQKINNTGLGSQSTVEKKFVPLSYEKVTVDEQKATGSRINDKDYAKETIMTVLLGFLVLIVIVGIFYGMILYDKSRAPSESVVGNVTAGSSNVKSSSVSTIEANKTELKTLPKDESNRLKGSQHYLIGDNKMSHLVGGSQSNRQSHFSFTQIRRHIQ